MRIRTDNCIGVGDPSAVLLDIEHDSTQVLEVDLVDDAGVGGNNRKIIESLLAPFQERVALHIALEFDLRIEVKRIRGAVVIDLYRVVDNQLCR